MLLLLAYPAGRDPFYVVSYWPENQDYTEKVASIVNWFRSKKGYNMIMDKMSTRDISSKGPLGWAETEIDKADKVLVFLSPGYIDTYSNDEPRPDTTQDQMRVWYEMQILKSTFAKTRSASKMVSILLDETISTQNLPPWAVTTYRWPKDQDKILMRLSDVPEMMAMEISSGTHSISVRV